MKNIRFIGHTARTALATTALAIIAMPVVAFGQAAFTFTLGGLTYSETFDAMGSSGTTFISGWTSSDTSMVVGNGSSNAGGIYNVGSSGSEERAFGSIASGSIQPIFGASFLNSTGSFISTMALAGFAELWRSGDNVVVESLPFEFSLDATSLSDGTWTPVAAMNLVEPNPLLTTAAARDGNLPEFRSAVSSGPTPVSLAWADATTIWIRWRDINAAGADSLVAIDDFSMTVTLGTPPKNLLWTPVTTIWNTTETNWTDIATSNISAFTAGDSVTFSNAAGGPVAIDAGGVVPGGVTVSAESGSYAFTGGPVNGNGTLTKSGAGTLDLTGQTTGNGFSGGVVATGGTVIVSDSNQLGATTSSVSLDSGATLSVTAPTTSSHPLTIGASGATIAIGSNAVIQSGPVTIDGLLTLTGTADLAISGIATFGFSGSLSIPAGSSVTLSQGSGVVTMRAGGVFDGDFNINSTARLNLNGFGLTYGGTGKINVLGTAIGAGSGGAAIVDGSFASFNALITNSENSTGGTITSDIVLNPAGPTHVAFTPGDITTATYTTASFLAFVGSNNGGLDISSKITGEGDVFLSGNSRFGGGTGTLTLTGQSTYLGNTSIDGGGIILIGVNNALPTTTNVMFGNLTGVGTLSPSLDLNGFNQQIASLSQGAFGVPGNFNVTNNSSTADSVLTISGSVTPVNPFGGRIADGINGFKLKLVKGGTNTTTLNGIAEFSTLDVVGGTLNLDAALTTPAGSTINVVPEGGTANLDISVSQTIAALNIGAGGVVTLETPPPPPAPGFIDGDEIGSGGFAGESAQPVPEPGSAVLLLGGIAALLGVRRRLR